jgi:azurin
LRATWRDKRATYISQAAECLLPYLSRTALIHIKEPPAVCDYSGRTIMKNTAILTLTIVSAILLLTGCGKSDASAPAKTSASAPASAVSNGPKEGRAITVTANDAMKFNIVELRAEPGEALAVTLKNQGTMPKFSMGHNWVLIAEGVDVVAFANDASMAAKTDYVPAAYRDRVIASTRLLGPNENDTVIFHAPTKPGRYVFLCTFPGHLQVGMKGELIVE